jgi:hypothetical protein
VRTRIDHRFVDTIPDELDEGVVYVCIQYETVVHKCCCGCGNEVVSPLHPLQWSITFNGETISLTPSIGNWSFPCRAHYWICAGEVRWAKTFDAEDVATLRADERELLAKHYGAPKPSIEAEPKPTNWWATLRAWIKRKASGSAR